MEGSIARGGYATFMTAVAAQRDTNLPTCQGPFRTYQSHILGLVKEGKRLRGTDVDSQYNEHSAFSKRFALNK